jgi:hypothetical protein
MSVALLTLLGLNTNMFVLALLLYSLLSRRARQGIDDLVLEALRYAG